VLHQLLQRVADQRLPTPAALAVVQRSVNRSADSAADRARSETPPSRNQGLTRRVPLSVLKSVVRARLLAWTSQEWWVQTATTGMCRGRKLYRLHPTFWKTPEIVKWLPLVPSQRTRVAIERLRLGNGSLNRFLHKIGTVDSPFCDHCPGITDEVEHRLFVCQHYEPLRRPLVHILQRLKLPMDLDTLLNLSGVPFDHKAKVVLGLGEFLSKSGLDRIFLWDPRPGHN
jgi:hypothetical protein